MFTDGRADLKNFVVCTVYSVVEEFEVNKVRDDIIPTVLIGHGSFDRGVFSP